MHTLVVDIVLPALSGFQSARTLSLSLSRSLSLDLDQAQGAC